MAGKPAGYSPVSESQFTMVLDAAWDAGVRWIDTAPGYGGGEGITRLAAWQNAKARSWCRVVKPGRPLTVTGPHSDLSVPSLVAEVSECSRKIGSPQAVLIKDPPESTYHDGSLRALLARLADRWPVAGIATHRLDLMPLLGNAPAGNLVVQMEFHLLNRFTAVRAADRAAKENWQVWAMQPLAYGFLGGRYTAGTRFPSDDWRSRMPGHVRTALTAGAVALHRRLPSALREYPLPQLALAWCLASSAVERVVIGPRTPEQFADAVTAAHLTAEPAVTEFIMDAHRLLLPQGPPPGAEV